MTTALRMNAGQQPKRPGANLLDSGSIEGKTDTFTKHWRTICGDMRKEGSIARPAASPPMKTDFQHHIRQVSEPTFPDAVALDPATFLELVQALPRGKA